MHWDKNTKVEQKDLLTDSFRWSKHVVHLDQIAEDHEEIRADEGKVAVDVSLLVQGELQVLGLGQCGLDLGTLELGLVQAIDEGLVLQNITLRVGEFLEQLLFVAC